MFIKIDGIKSMKDAFIGNIPINTLNTTHRIYLIHPET